MPDSPTSPGAHIREVQSGARTITGVETSIALFVGTSADGPMRDPVRCLTYTDFARTFSEDSSTSDLARYVELFFLNGGTTCYVMRIADSAGGDDGGTASPSDYDEAYSIIDREVDLFNLLLLPSASGLDRSSLWGPASLFCQQRRALLLMDAPTWPDVDAATAALSSLRAGLVNDHSALYYPRLTVDEEGLPVALGPTGAIAGVMARTDATRGVWKAPAGIEADLRGVTGLENRLSDRENGVLNARAINTLRVLPDSVLCWGARTNDGDDSHRSDYKYVPVRRLALFLEESLSRGLRWTVFEPNDEPLWGQIRLLVGSFMHGLFTRGALQGLTPSDAFFVSCDDQTTTQDDRDAGIVNVLVGFAPLKPAEFVVLHLRQLAGQVDVADPTPPPP